MKTFKELGLNAEILKSLAELGFEEPTPIQEQTIPFILESKQDLTALAQTGTGKTAAFSLPILCQIKTDGVSLQAIVLCPTRELCIQSAQGIREMARHSTGIVVTPVYGGERIDLQIRSLKRGTNIVVGTPGRVHDLIRRKILKLQTIKWLVLDEADEMLDMGFKDDLDSILEQTPADRRTLLFSATMSKGVSTIAKNYMHNAHEISIGHKNVGAENVSHEYYIVQTRDRFEALKRILDYLPGVYGILFCRTRRETQDVADRLRQANYEVEAIHGDVSQNIRTKIMERFKKKQIRVLVATDVAARGIDVKNLTHIINYSLPDQNISYTHRSGRTGRASQSGVSISLVGSREIRRIKELERAIGKPFEHKQVPKGEDVYKKLIDNFVTAVQKSDTEAVAHEKYVVEVIDRLKAVKKEDLIKYFVTKELTPIIEEHKNNRNLNVEAKPVGDRGKELKDSVTLKINFGKNHRFDIKALFSLINSSPKLRGMDIGQINLMSEYSVFAVESKYVIEAIRSLTGVQFNGKKIRVSKSDEPISQVRSQYSRSSGGGENRGGGGYRGGGSGRRRWSNKGDSSISAPWAKKKNFGKSRRKR